jgi:hypothetical protein
VDCRALSAKTACHEWLTPDEYRTLRATRRCPDCGQSLLFGRSDRLAPLPAARRTLVLFMHFKNVRRDGTLKDGGLDLYFCSRCRSEYAFGPRFGDGRYRMLRLP